LNHSLTITAKCCNSKLHYAGEKVFEGVTMMDVETVEKVKKERKPRTTKVEEVKGPNPKWIQPKNETVRAGKRGITNQGMIEALLDAGNDESTLTVLFESYPEVFISSAKYLKDSLKPLFESIINKNENFKEVVLPRRRKA
jgi:hypothetical protein